MKLFSNRKRTALVAAGAGVALVIGAGIAEAYWSSTGGGNGAMSTAHNGNSNLQVFGSELEPNHMGPGHAPAPVQLNIVNPSTNSTSSYVTSVTATINSAATPWNAGPPACSASDFQLQAGASSALQATGSTAAGVQTVTIPIGVELAPGQSYAGAVYFEGFVDDSTNQSACEAQGVSVSYTTN